MTEFWSSTQKTRCAAELESTIEKAVGKTGLMLFVAFDHGAVISKTTGRGAGRIMRFVIGNLLIMKEMAKHVPDAGSYAPVKLNQLLADTMTLLDLYKKSHWQVAGPTFYQLHLLFDKHYDEQVELVDSIAERVQLLGGVSIAMAADVADTTQIERPSRGREAVAVQLSRLLDAHQIVIRQTRRLARRAAEMGDDGTNDLLVSEVLRTNELQVWFLSEHLVEVVGPWAVRHKPRGRNRLAP